jgi:DNA-binding transcriptional ArsR family regulator
LHRPAARSILNHMVNYSPHLDATFGALSDPTRRAILTRLARGPASVTEIASPFDMSLPAVSKHVRVLEDAGLVARAKKGREHTITLTPTPHVDATRWLTESRKFWEGTLDRLADVLTQTTKQEESWPPKRNSSAKRRSRSSAASPRPRKPSTVPGSKRKR